MAKSPPPGTSSWLPHLAADASAEQLLRSVLQSDPLTILLQALEPHSKLHLVGGTVRDCFSQVAPSDLDVASVLRPNEVHARLAAKGIRVIDTGIAHGTVLALVGDVSIEITTFRLPGSRAASAYSDTIEIDCSGRDFTINAIAVECSSGQVIDPFNGRADNTAGILRAVGDAHMRFQEDPLRILRMVRFGPAQGRKVVPATLEGAQKVLAQIESVSVERIRDELLKILLSPTAGSGLRFMAEHGILKQILPEMLATVGFEQNTFHTQDVFEHTLTVLDRAENTPLVRLAALFHDLGKPATLSVGADAERHFYKHELVSETLAHEIMTRLKFSKEEIKSVGQIVRLHMRPLDCGPTGVRRLLKELGEYFEAWKALKYADKTPTASEEDFKEQSCRFDALVEAERSRPKGSVFDALAIDGNDLMELGYTEGPLIGQALRRLQELVIEIPENNERELLLEQAREWLKAQ